MNDRIKNVLVVGIAFGIPNGMFWFAYSFTENIIAVILYIQGKKILNLGGC
jgi:hypothetical protein